MERGREIEVNDYDQDTINTFKELVITEMQPEGTWVMNFGKYNADDDIEITEGLANTLLSLKHKILETENI
jgi:hypothetical protein